MKIRYVLALAVVVAAAVLYLTSRSTVADNAPAAVAPTPAALPADIGRYTITPITIEKDGVHVLFLIRLDTVTGKSWYSDCGNTPGKWTEM
jgi:hypothetical protein